MKIFFNFFLISCALVAYTHSVLYDSAQQEETTLLNCVFKGCSCNDEDQLTSTEIGNNQDGNLSPLGVGVDVTCKAEDSNGNEVFPERDTSHKQPTSISVLEASRNSFIHIPDDRFSGLSIAVLDLSHNELSSLSNGIFRGIVQLEVLDLSHNKISKIDEQTFNSFPSTFITLKLEQNKLGQMDPQVLANLFSNLKSLRTIDLRNNELTQIPDLKNLTLLDELSLAHNQIEHISSNIPSKVYELNLEANRIKHLSANMFTNLNNLKYLNLYSNQISHIDANTFAHNTKLTTILLGHNYIKQIPDRLFYSLINLEKLDLSAQNQILRDVEDYAFDRVSNVHPLRVDLSRNRIAKFGSKAFCSRNRTYPYANIKEVDIAQNQMIVLNSCILRQLSKGYNDYQTMQKQGQLDDKLKPKVSFKQSKINEKIGPNLKCDCEITRSLNFVDFDGECESTDGILIEIMKYQCPSAQLLSSQSVEQSCLSKPEFDCIEEEPTPAAPEQPSSTSNLPVETSTVPNTPSSTVSSTKNVEKKEEVNKPSAEPTKNQNNQNRNDQATKQPLAVTENSANTKLLLSTSSKIFIFISSVLLSLSL